MTVNEPYDFNSTHPAHAEPNTTIYGRISSNQFAGEHEAFMHPAIDEILPEAEANQAAKEITNALGCAVEVEYMHQFWTGEGFEAPFASHTFAPELDCGIEF